MWSPANRRSCCWLASNVSTKSSTTSLLTDPSNAHECLCAWLQDSSTFTHSANATSWQFSTALASFLEVTLTHGVVHILLHQFQEKKYQRIVKDSAPEGSSPTFLLRHEVLRKQCPPVLTSLPPLRFRLMAQEDGACTELEICGKRQLH